MSGRLASDDSWLSETKRSSSELTPMLLQQLRRRPGGRHAAARQHHDVIAERRRLRASRDSRRGRTRPAIAQRAQQRVQRARAHHVQTARRLVENQVHAESCTSAQARATFTRWPCESVRVNDIGGVAQAELGDEIRSRATRADGHPSREARRSSGCARAPSAARRGHGRVEARRAVAPGTPSSVVRPMLDLARIRPAAGRTRSERRRLARRRSVRAAP